MMNDLISRQAAIKCIDATHIFTEPWGEALLKKLPSVDIRERLDNAYMHGATEAEAKYRAILDTMQKVVHCKDCNEYQDVHQWCKLHEIEMQPMDFCSYGESKDAAD